VQGSLGDLEGPVDDQALLLSKGGLGGHQVTDLGLRHVLPLLRWIAAHESHRDVSRPGQQPHNRSGRSGHRRERPGGHQTPPFGALHSYAFGGQLTEHERHVGQDPGLLTYAQ